ncbi:MAG: hypothetical protein QOK31_607 [Solirubrobacteraceae bacterium]|jgi:hypothetical protein|nr:hypothetical protein [Solirubrobacteraceae bacterium]
MHNERMASRELGRGRIPRLAATSYGTLRGGSELAAALVCVPGFDRRRIPRFAAASYATLRGGSELAAALLGLAFRRWDRARLMGVVVFILVAALPWVLWHRVLGEITSEFRLDLGYVVSELSPWLLIAGGTLFLLPVVWSAGRDPESRFYPRARGAYLGWGVTLYLLGMGLAGMVAQLAQLTRV